MGQTLKKELFTVKEAAKFLGVDPELLRNWDRAGKIKTRRNPLNNYRVYKLEELQALKKTISGDLIVDVCL